MHSNLPTQKALSYLLSLNNKNLDKLKKLITIFPNLVSERIHCNNALSYEKKTLLAFAVEKAVQFHFVSSQNKYDTMLELINFLVKEKSDLNATATIQEVDYNDRHEFTVLGISTSCKHLFNHLIDLGARMNKDEILYFKEKLANNNNPNSINFNEEVKNYLVMHEKEELEAIIKNSQQSTTKKIKL